MHLNQPVVEIAATPDGGGYWLVAAGGGIFSVGDAQFLGSMGATPLSKPVVGMTADPAGRGDRMVAGDGGSSASVHPSLAVWVPILQPHRS